MSAQPQPTEEEIRAYEEQLSRVTAVEIALQASASLLNVGGRKLGLAEGAEQERDLEQVRDAVDAVRALMPVLERRMSAAQARPLRDALSQLQMAYAQLVQGEGSPRSAEEGSPASGGGQSPEHDQGSAKKPPSPGGEEQRPAGPAESSGRLWVPGR